MEEFWKSSGAPLLTLNPGNTMPRRAEWNPSCPQKSEDSMRGVGMVLLTGAAAVVLWKVFAALFIGLLGMAFKVALVVGVVYLFMKIFENNKKEE